MSWIIINNEIGTASNKKFTQTEFKLGTKYISMKQPAKIFNNYFINCVDVLITQQPKLNRLYFHLGNHILMSSCKSSIFQLLRRKLYAQYLH
jgi:hypothetical protein